MVGILDNVNNLANITRYHSSAYPCLVPGIDARKDSGKALNVDGISKYKIVLEVGLEVVMRLTWIKRVLNV